MKMPAENSYLSRLNQDSGIRMKRKLIISDRLIASILRRRLKWAPGAVDIVQHVHEVEAKVNRHPYDFIITDAHVQGTRSADHLQYLRAQCPTAKIIVLDHDRGSLRESSETLSLHRVALPMTLDQISDLINTIGQ